jgi:hypothetical protein
LRNIHITGKFKTGRCIFAHIKLCARCDEVKICCSWKCVFSIVQIKVGCFSIFNPYYVRYFEPDFFERFVGKTMSDDILISYYFRFKNIKMFVVPYHEEIDNVQTFEQWQNFNGVCTFPVLRHAHSLNNTGANHPDMFEPKFYRPRELDFALLTPFN